jgi:hypothetical protein
MPDTGTRSYDNIKRSQVDEMFNALISRGSKVSGNNPWDIDTDRHGVRLRGEWNEATLVLSITVLDTAWYVPREAVWDNIDSLMRRLRDEG